MKKRKNFLSCYHFYSSIFIRIYCIQLWYVDDKSGNGA